MFLIQIAKGTFINAEKIDFIDINTGIKVYLTNDDQSCYKIEEGYESTFMNNLQALNQNIVSVEKCYYNLKDAAEE
jgi:hypothetical protein